MGKVEIFAGMALCRACVVKELESVKAHQSPEKQQERINNFQSLVEKSREIDNAIEVRSDIFNAQTVAIVELKAAIESDATIQNKPFALASELDKRYKHLKDVVFGLTQQIVDKTSEQKAIQIYLNQLSNQLRAEEREKLKLTDITYQPKPIKPVKPKTIRTASAKLDKAMLRKFANELGVAEFTLQMLVVSKGITVEAAANLLRKTINEGKSES